MCACSPAVYLVQVCVAAAVESLLVKVSLSLPQDLPLESAQNKQINDP